MNFVFRADASLDIGTGHVMRCLTLADALRHTGATCRFVCRTLPGNLLDFIRQRGHQAFGLPVADGDMAKETSDEPVPPHAAWLCCGWLTDVEQTLAVLDGTPIDWMIVDHYALDARWEARVRVACDQVMAIDDLADRNHDCDLLLDANLGRNQGDYIGRVPSACKVLTGAKYALLRPEFAALRAYSLERRASAQLRHLLISMGGIDKNNATGAVLDALRDCPLHADCRITVVMGQYAPWLEEVKSQALQLPWPTTVRVNVADMAQLMADSDLAIGAAGTTAWERCSIGLPTLAVVLAGNQREGAKALEAAGAVLLLEDHGAIAHGLKAKLSLLALPDRLERMQTACLSITDGSGTQRIVSELSHV